MSKEYIEHDFYFLGNNTFPVVGSPDGQPWRSKDVSSAGSPTAVGAGGYYVQTLASNDEAEQLTLYFGDILPYAIEKLIQVDIWAKVSASLASTVTASMGMASAQNATVESMTTLALFKCVGSNALVVSTDDNVTDLSDKATGLTLGTTEKRLCMEFATGVKSVMGGVSLGKQVLFSAENDRGQLVPVARNVNFDMSGAADGTMLQPFVQLQKASGASTPALSIRRIRIRTKQ